MRPAERCPGLGLGLNPGLVLISAMCVLACAPVPPADTGCELGEWTNGLQAVDRKLLGLAAEYPADTAVRANEQLLASSQRARRELAWRTVDKILAPVPFAESLPELVDGVPAEIPRWHTWYGRDELRRLFLRMYEQLGPAGRDARTRFSDVDLDLALAWNVDYLEELENWPEERWLEYLDAIDQAAEVSGVGGIGRVAYSPAAARHFLASYPEILQCLNAGVPAPFAAGDERGERQFARVPIQIDACSSQSFGPYFVADSEVLRATIDGDSSGLTVVGYRDRQQVECRAVDGGSCEVSGPGAVYIDVVSRGRAAGRSGERAGASAPMLAIDYSAAEPDWAPCLDGPFASDAVLIKADWHRAQLGFQLPVYDTSADALVRRRAAGTFDWGEPDSFADPGPEDIYTAALNNGNVYRLAGLHIMTKELDHWLWITLFWSAEPDSDFGADRPADLSALTGPWRNYKMCVVTAFAEGDADPTGGFAETAPSLAAALAVVHGGRRGAPTWCSNPYIELGPGNADSSCIGCHQHGGTGLLSEVILGDPHTYPAHGRTNIRNNFPADYSWAMDTGDNLGRTFADIVEYYDSFEASGQPPAP